MVQNHLDCVADLDAIIQRLVVEGVIDISIRHSNMVGGRMELGDIRMRLSVINRNQGRIRNRMTPIRYGCHYLHCFLSFHLLTACQDNAHQDTDQQNNPFHKNSSSNCSEVCTSESIPSQRCSNKCYSFYYTTIYTKIQMVLD